MVFWIVVFKILTLYTLNAVIITNRRIITNEQHAFFSKEMSELRGHRIQDVTIHVTGILETFFGFGDIVVQTAASEKEFNFSKIPNPEKVKDVIMHMAGSIQSREKTFSE